MMIKKKRITAALLALGLGAVTMFSQFPVSAAEETAQNTDAAAQTANPSVVVTNGIDGCSRCVFGFMVISFSVDCI